MVMMTNQIRFSIFTLALILVAVIIFIYAGGSYLFYLVAGIAIIAGMINFWMVSKDTRAEPVVESAAPVRRRKYTRSTRKRR